jgi:hypothetical protein
LGGYLIEDYLKKKKTIVKSNRTNNLSFVCIFDEKDGGYLPRMLDTLPDCEKVLLLVKNGEVDKLELHTETEKLKVGILYLKEFAFDKARNYAKEVATNDWIFSIDADERLCIDQHEVILNLTKQIQYDCFQFVICDTPTAQSGIVRRMFRKELNWVGKAHEQIISDKVARTNILIRHEGYTSKETLIEKQERNLKLMLKDIDNNTNEYYYNIILNSAKNIKEFRDGEKNTDR